MRIVGGAAKGRRLAAPAAATRPTSDMAREAMFNSLAGTVRLDGGRVLDLFAGTGAVGLEALSRGAAEIVLVERDRAALDVLRRNVATVGLPGASVVARAVATYLAEPPGEPFDLVFADPPYATSRETVYRLLAQLSEPAWLADGAMVVVESGAHTGPSDWAASFLTLERQKRYGDSELWYFRRQ
jgi:16S rRNA (guanine966-N2)-methyltransferase